MRVEDTDLGRGDLGRGNLGIFRRISWGAIFAGLAVALVVQLTLGFLGVAIGATTVDPLTERRPLEGLGMGAGIWLFVSTILALFSGGWVAGRLAAFPRALDNALHGIVTWAAAMLLTFYLLGSAVGSIMSGAANVMGRTASVMAPQIREAAGAAVQQTGGGDIGAIQQQIQSTAQRAKDPQAKQQVQAEITDSMKKFLGGTATEQDRQEVVNVLTKNTDMSEQEAEQTVAQWQQKAQQVGQQARQTGEKAAKGIAATGWTLFAAMIVGAVSAGIGGMVATRRETRVTVGTTEGTVRERE